MLTTRALSAALLLGLVSSFSASAAEQRAEAKEQAQPRAPASEEAAAAERLELLPPVVGVTERQASHHLAGVALDGFDPVSYFLGAGPVPGRAAHEVLWGGVSWRFSSAANRQAFLTDPEIYAPRLGGHDADALRRGTLAEADPRFYLIRPQGLYLFRSREGRDAFLADESLFAAAETAWTTKKSTLVAR